MDKLNMDWTNRIFERLKIIFKEKWSERYERTPSMKALYLSQWSSGLSGLSAPEIKKAITILECFTPPHVPSVIEFYHYAKGNIGAHRKKESRFQDASQPEVAHQYLSDIKNKLKRGIVNRGT